MKRGGKRMRKWRRRKWRNVRSGIITIRKWRQMR